MKSVEKAVFGSRSVESVRCLCWTRRHVKTIIRQQPLNFLPRCLSFKHSTHSSHYTDLSELHIQLYRSAARLPIRHPCCMMCVPKLNRHPLINRVSSNLVWLCLGVRGHTAKRRDESPSVSQKVISFNIILRGMSGCCYKQLPSKIKFKSKKKF